MLKTPIYLDNNATTPMDPRVLEAMLPYFTEKFGNAASRNHPFGWVAEEGVDYAREQVAKLIGATEKEIIFTSGATESDNLAIKGVYEMYKDKGNHIITLTTEHKAVLDACKHLEKSGANITYLDVESDGLVDLQKLEAAMTNQTILVAIMYANNEIGVIQPVKEISAIAHKLHEFPPFNLLHKVQGAAEKVASGVLNKLSYYATELAGAPGPYEFVALAAIIGIVAEVQFKGMAKTAIINLIPGIGTIASIISYVAMGLAVVGIVEALIKKQGEDQKSDH